MYNQYYRLHKGACVSLILTILVVTVGFLIGMLFFGAFLHKKKIAEAFEQAQEESKRILIAARKEADDIVREAMSEAKSENRRRRKIFDDEAKKRRSELAKQERKNTDKESSLNERLKELEGFEESLRSKGKQLERDERNSLKVLAETELLLEKYEKMLARVANMSAEEARRELMKLLEEDAKRRFQKRLREMEVEAQKEAQAKATEIVSLATQRVASEYVNDAAVTVVPLPNEDMKGRIIGREGRNIRSLEQATGVDLIIDDTPEAVIISCFNPIRREVAKLTLERLVADGRIHPARIEETAQRIQKEFDNTLREYGEQASFDVGVTDLHPELLTFLGKLRFRSVGNQSVLEHSIETAYICGTMAAEVGLDSKLARRAGLLHDIGKAIDQETEGHHAELGATLLKRYGETVEVCESAGSHHSATLNFASPYAVFVNAANQLSGKRPGARKEALASYIKRLSAMEELAAGFSGVSKAFVLQAGREVRALVMPNERSDEQVRALAVDIASELRRQISFPGNVQVTVLKESKHIAYAS